MPGIKRDSKPYVQPWKLASELEHGDGIDVGLDDDPAYIVGTHQLPDGEVMVVLTCLADTVFRTVRDVQARLRELRAEKRCTSPRCTCPGPTMTRSDCPPHGEADREQS